MIYCIIMEISAFTLKIYYNKYITKIGGVYDWFGKYTCNLQTPTKTSHLKIIAAT